MRFAYYSSLIQRCVLLRRSIRVNYRAAAGLLVISAAIAAAAVGVPLDFVLFGSTLAGIALLHHRALPIALAGLAAITFYKLCFTSFATGTGFAGLGVHLQHEWVILANLFALLTGFALLSRHFEESQIPSLLLRFLPDGWRGAFVLLAIVFVLSSFLDNIAGAMIGATMAGVVFQRKLHIGYLAAIVAASNAGGAGSVLGDTTTTMMWIAGVPALNVLDAYVASVTAFVVFAIPASLQQHGYAQFERRTLHRVHLDWPRAGVVIVIVIAALAANVATNLFAPTLGDRFPVIGAAVWAAILLTASIRRPDWSVMPATARSSTFLLALVLAASMMPIEQLPPASWQTTFGLGFLSSVFDNIPLTALALKQGGYDWGFLAYAVGFGGSMIWFGSSAGIAVSSVYPQAKSVNRWLAHGWHIILGYVIGFFVLLTLVGWHAGDRYTRASMFDPHILNRRLDAWAHLHRSEVLEHSLRVGRDAGEQAKRLDCLEHRHAAAIEGSAADAASSTQQFRFHRKVNDLGNP